MPPIAPFRAMLEFATGGLTPVGGEFSRRLSEMAGAYADTEATEKLIAECDDPVVYVGYDASVPEEQGHLLFRSTIVYPGTVGSEYFMTKGHHHVNDTAEFYLGMSGEGWMLMESRTGEYAQEMLVPYGAVYVPPGWAHRTVNTGDEPLVFLAVYPGDAGHDYAAIERAGFSRRVFKTGEGPEFRQA